MPLRNLFFSILGPKNLPKWSEHGATIGEKVVPTTLQKNIHKNNDDFLTFFEFCEKVDVNNMLQKHIQNNDFCIAEPRTTFYKKH